MGCCSGKTATDNGDRYDGLDAHIKFYRGQTVPLDTRENMPHAQEDATPATDDRRVLPPVLLQYWHTARRWRWVLAAIVGGTLIAGVIVTFLMQPLYTAKAQIEISRQQKNVTNVEGVEAPEAGRDAEFYATQYALLRAVSLAERVESSLNLGASNEFFENHGVEPAVGATARRRQASRLLLTHVSIEPVRSSRLVDISYTSRSARQSADISNAWVREFIAANMNREFSSTAEARRFLEERLATLRQRTEDSERRVVDFASANGIVTLEVARDAEGRTQTQRTLVGTDLEALNQELNAARSERIAAESRMAGTGRGANSDALANATIASLRQRRAEISSEYARLMTQYEPGYPAARALRSQMDELDAAVAAELARLNNARRQDYQQALSRERQLSGMVDRLRADLDRQQRNTIQYNIYQREADTNRQLYDSLLQRYKEIGVAGSVGTNNIAIVDQASAPGSPSSPNLYLNIAIALALGLILAGATVVILEQIDEGIKSPTDVPDLLSLPLLGNVPLADRDPMAAVADVKSTLSESYFSIRSALAFSTNHGFPRSISIVSNQPGEGKSTTAAALAVTLGRTGKSVLLVDGDLRSPSIHTLLAVSNAAGFSNLLVGDNDLAAVQPSVFKGVSVMPSGPLPPSPSELLSNERLSEVIAMMCAAYDHVVIDCPPVLGLSDAPLLVRASEGALFVVEPGRSAVRSIKSALQRLKMAGGVVLGVIVTKIDINSQLYGYSYGYGYGKKYGYGDGLSYGSKAAGHGTDAAGTQAA